MRYIIKNAGDLASLCIVKKNEIVAFTDKSPLKWDYNGELKTISTYDAVGFYKDNKCDGILFPDGIELDLLFRMVKEFISLGVSETDIYILQPNRIKGYVVSAYKDYNRLKYIEIHAADHCNLNCKGCVHFSPLVKEPIFPKIEEFEKDIIQLHSKVELIDRIHILGGEPLLNPDIGKLLHIVHNIYPFSELSIVTNGILLKSISKGVIDAILGCNAWINVSVYPPMMESITNTAIHLKKLGMKIRFTDSIYTFSYALDRKGGHSTGTNRINCRCPNLYRGKLAVCPIICYLDYFNDYFGTKLESQDGLIDIYDPNLTYDDILMELHKVRSVCDYCLYISEEDGVERKWEQSEKIKTISDYMIE